MSKIFQSSIFDNEKSDAITILILLIFVIFLIHLVFVIFLIFMIFMILIIFFVLVILLILIIFVIFVIHFKNLKRSDNQDFTCEHLKQPKKILVAPVPSDFYYTTRHNRILTCFFCLRLPWAKFFNSQKFSSFFHA